MNNQSISQIKKADFDPQWSRVVKGLDRETPANGPGQAEKVKPAETNAAVNKAPLGDVYLRFEVNDETRDVTIYVVDRASKNVVRTIPPEQANKLRAGDLLHLLA